MVLLDNLNTLYGSAPESEYEAAPAWLEDLALQNAKVHLTEFLKKLAPEDRVAIYGLRHSLHVLCDFTCSREQLLEVLKNYDSRSVTDRAVVEPGAKHAPVQGGYADAFENGAAAFRAGSANEERAAETMTALQQIAAHVANIPGRKNLVWLTANLPFPPAAMARILSPAEIAAYPIDARGLLARTTPAALDEHSHTLGSGPGAVSIDGAAPAQSSEPIGLSTMEELASDTGGQAFVNTNDITGAIRKAVEDSTVTYTLGFYINRDALDGKFHEVKVEVRGKDLTIRYPRGYFAFRDATPTKNEDQLRLMTAVQSPIESSSIPVEATVERAAQPPHWFKVACSIDAHGLRLAQNGNLRKGAVDVYSIEQDETGNVLLQSGKTFNLELPESRYDALLKSGLLFHELVQPRPNATTLRLLVVDRSSNYVGSVIIPLSDVH